MILYVLLAFSLLDNLKTDMNLLKNFLLKHLRGVVMLAVVSTILFLLLLIDSNVWNVLRFSRHEIMAGEIWRVLTGHLVHTNFAHGIMNIAAFLLTCFFAGPMMRDWLWLLLGVFVMLLISVGLLLFSPAVQWYVGFSGVIHGLLAGPLLIGAVQEKDKFFALGCVLLVAKVISEQMPNFDVGHLYEVIDAAVVVDAHMYGLIAGLLFGIFYLVVHRFFLKIS